MEEASRDALALAVAQHWTQFRSHLDLPAQVPELLRAPSLANLIAEASDIVVQVLDMRRFKSVYASDNVLEVSGFTANEINSHGVWRYFRNLSFRELGYHVRNARLISGQTKALPPRTHFSSALINGGIRTKTRTRKRILAKNFSLEFDEKGVQKYQLFLWKDASHLFRSEVVSWRHEWWVEGGEKVIWTFHADKLKFLDQDFFSARELEVLRMIGLGLSSKDIAEQLAISPLTVDNHRKNLIGRLQVKSTDGLVEVCKWLKLI